MTIADLISTYVSSRLDTRESTRQNLQTCGDRLSTYFPNADIGNLTLGDADKWLIHLKCNYAPATVGRTVKRARQFFQSALRQGLVTTNPFADLKAPGQANRERTYFVTRYTTKLVLDACPDDRWRLIVALSRFGGLRCPCEHRELDWGDIEDDRIEVKSPKTGNRLVPLFHELRPFLDALRPNCGFVIKRPCEEPVNGPNWRTQFMRIIRKAGLKPWPRVFHNLRASRETELAEKHPLHVVATWMGNSALVAQKHYLSVTEEDFRKALT